MTASPDDLLPPARLTRHGIPVDRSLRILALGTFVNRFGGGATATTFALYFTREVGFSATQVGLALSIAAVAAFFAQLPLGQLADVRGPREVQRALTIAWGVSGFGLLVVRELWSLVVVLSVMWVFQAGGGAVRNGYIARIAVGGRGVAFKGYLRAVTNIAIALGASVGGIALWVNRPWAYLAVFAFDALTSIAAGVVTTWLPHLEPAPARRAGEPRLAVLQDVPYVAMTLLSSVVSLHFIVIDVGIPLWIGRDTSAPTAMVAIVLILNTVIVSLFQVRATRGIDDVRASARASLVGGIWLAAAFVVFGFTDAPGPWAAAALLVVAASVQVVGEMLTSAGQFGLSMGLAPMERQGQYQGFSGMGFSLSRMVGPTLVTLLCVEWGRPGWFVMAALVLGAGIALVPVSRWAQATRERYDAGSATG